MSSWSKRSPHVKQILFYLLLAVVIAGGFGVRYRAAVKHRFPTGDEGPWLRMAARAGTSSFLQSRVVEHDLYIHRGIPHPEDNRSPLYPLLIAGVNLILGDLVRSGQLLNLLVWTTLTLMVSLALQRRFGWWAGIAAALYLGASSHLIRFSVQIYPDLLVALGFVTAIAYAHRATASLKNAVLYALLGGGLLLIKSTGLVVLVLPFFLPLWRRDRTALLRAGGICVGALLVALPWMVRNLTLFGSPFYQVSVYNLYVEDFYDLLTVGTPRPSLSRYLAEQGIIHLIQRPVAGFGRMMRLFGWFDNHLVTALFPLAVMGGVEAWRRRLPVVRSFLLFTLCYLPVMSYIAYAVWVHRFTLVFYVAVYAGAAAGVAALQRHLRRIVSPRIATVAALVIMVLPLYTARYPLEFYSSSRGGDLSRDRAARAIIAKTTALVPRDARFYSSFLGQYAWCHSLGTVNQLRWHSFDDFAGVLESYNVGYLLTGPADNKVVQQLKEHPRFGPLDTLAVEGPFALIRATGTRMDNP